jgi:hypothetical protein
MNVQQGSKDSSKAGPMATADLCPCVVCLPHVHGGVFPCGIKLLQEQEQGHSSESRVLHYAPHMRLTCLTEPTVASEGWNSNAFMHRLCAAISVVMTFALMEKRRMWPVEYAPTARSPRVATAVHGWKAPAFLKTGYRKDNNSNRQTSVTRCETRLSQC